MVSSSEFVKRRKDGQADAVHVRVPAALGELAGVRGRAAAARTVRAQRMTIACGVRTLSLAGVVRVHIQ